MTGDEIIALSKKHTISEWGRSGCGRSDSRGSRRRASTSDAGRKALHRLQQPVDVREHRPRRSARGQGDPGTGGDARRTRTRWHGDGAARAAWRQARDDHARRYRRLLLHQRRRRGQRERASRSRALLTGRQKILARYRSYHGATAAAMAATGEPRRWSTSRRCRVSCTCSIRYHGVDARPGHRRTVACGTSRK